MRDELSIMQGESAVLLTVNAKMIKILVKHIDRNGQKVLY